MRLKSNACQNHLKKAAITNGELGEKEELKVRNEGIKHGLDKSERGKNAEQMG